MYVVYGFCLRGGRMALISVRQVCKNQMSVLLRASAESKNYFIKTISGGKDTLKFLQIYFSVT